MVGLRTQENDKFLRFWDMVQECAAKTDSVFFLDCGEGNEFENAEMEGEELTGWLIPNDKVKEFDAEFRRGGSIDDKWADFLASVYWRQKNGKIEVTVELIEF